MSFEWSPIPPDRTADWNRTLLGTDALLYQYPLWLEALRQPFLSPQYFCCRSSMGVTVAYAAVLGIGLPGFRIAVLNGGPIALGADPVPDQAFIALWHRFRRSGYFCVRVANASQSTFEAVYRTCPTEEFDPFPWYSSTDNALVIDEAESDEALLARFKKQARSEIRKAADLGYCIEATDSPEAIRTAWPVIEAMETRKGRRIVRRRSISYERLARMAQPYRSSRIYLARVGDRVVQIIFVVRDRDIAHYVLGGLDVAALKTPVSPATLVHWIAMREFFERGVQHYSLGNDNSGPLQAFKHKFRPRRIEYPPIRTAIIKPIIYRLWKTAFAPLFRQREVSRSEE